MINSNLIKSFMLKNKLSKGEFCRRANISIGVLNKMLIGKTNIRLRNVLKIVQLLQIKSDDLIIKTPTKK